MASKTIVPVDLKTLSDAIRSGEKPLVCVLGISFSDLLGFDINSLNDYVDDTILGSASILSNISYRPVGADGDEVLVEVTGYIDEY